MFAIVSMMRMTGVEISKKSKCAERTFRHAPHSVYEIYSVLKLFEIAVRSAHFDFFDISTPVMRIMLTMANIV